MGALERYILRSTTTSFFTTLIAITGVVWVAQVLREFELITAKGQSFWTFLVMTLLVVPSVAIMITPFALFGAVAFVLNRLNSDSELAAINAAGIPPTRLMKPFLVLSLIISVAAGALSLTAVPSALRAIREMVTEIRADIILNVLREGAFTNLDNKVTLHVRRRDEGAKLTGLLIDDNRNAEENIVYTAESGQILRNDDGTFLLLRNGSLQRKSVTDPDPSIVVFDSYAFDLSPFTERELVMVYRARELFLSELWSSREDLGLSLQRLRAELHERLSNGIYPITFMLVAFAALAQVRTTRSSRYFGLVGAVLVIFLIRIAGLGIVNLARSAPWAGPVVYVLPLLACLISIAIALGYIRLPQFSLAGLLRLRRKQVA